MFVVLSTNVVTVLIVRHDIAEILLKVALNTKKNRINCYIMLQFRVLSSI
jgi:hypothetical protein